jgi:nitrate reductase NapE component
MIYEENPLRVEMVPTLVPVAHEVQDEIRINVAGEPVIDPKRDSVQTNERNQNIKTKCKNALDFAYLVFLLLLLIGIFGAFIMFLVWMSKPDVFGKNFNNY